MFSQTGFSLAVPSSLSSKTSLKIMGCPRRLLAKCFHWRWRPIGAAFQRNRLCQQRRYNGRKCAFLLRDLAAAANLPPHGRSSPSNLWICLTGRWTERADTDIDINDIHLLAAAVHIHIKLHSEGFQIPASRPSAASSLLLPTCSQTLPLSSPGPSLITLHSCTQPGRSKML